VSREIDGDGRTLADRIPTGGGGFVVGDGRKVDRASGQRRFRPYSTYKDSGVEWLGGIPAHWKVRRLKHLAALNPESLAEDTDPAQEMVYVDIRGVDSLGRIVERERLVFASAPSRARRLVCDGDVIVSTVRTYLRAIAPISDPEPDMVVSTGFAVVRPTDGLTTDFASYALRAPYFVECVVANSKGVSFPAINESEMATYELAVPPEPEQYAIAAFLDRETARIDALVAKKEHLIELLQEKRIALITRVVTKGLDPNVPMSDSGVEWVREIPTHWKVTPLKRVTSIRYGLGEPPGLLADGLPFIRATNVMKGRIVDQEMQFVDPRDVPWNRDPALRTDDIIVVRSGAYTGDSAIIPPEYDGAIAGYDMVVRPRPGTASFLAWALLSRYVLEAQIELESMRAAQPHLNAQELGAALILLPPDSEQRAIAAFLDRETARIDALLAKVREAIDRLNELRTALISAAVTGKIDVREEPA
jgi:type I restriction enzyme S subunit